MNRIRKKGISALVGVALSAAVVGLFGIFAPKPQPASTQTLKEPVKIGFIGDSITYGTGGTRSAVQVEIATLGSNYTGINRGVSRSTTADWQPGKKDYEKAIAAFKAQNVSVVSIMLGTNDASDLHSMSPMVYRRNLLAMINGLRNEGNIRTVVLNYPPYTVPKPASHWSKASLDRLRSYMPVISSLADGKFVVLGDTKAYAYFSEHPEELGDGVHPNDTGYYNLGQLWATAFKEVAGERHDMPAFLAQNMPKK